jgi:hypothetical protein
VNSTIILSWYLGGMQSYLEGAGGGGGGESSTSSGTGGSGAFGLYIQGQRIDLSNTIIYANGIDGELGYVSDGGGGGGGGCGRIIIAYGSSYLPASYNTVGGAAGRGRGMEGYWGGSGGGPCNPLAYQYSSEPITVLGPPPLPGPCYSANGMTPNDPISVYLAGSWFTVSASSINASGARMGINGAGYPLVLGQAQLIPGSGGYSFTLNLTALGSAPVSADLAICIFYSAATTTMTSIATSSSTTAPTSSASTTTTIPQTSKPSPAEGEAAGGISAILLILLLIALFSDDQRKNPRGA